MAAAIRHFPRGPGAFQQRCDTWRWVGGWWAVHWGAQQRMVAQCVRHDGVPPLSAQSSLPQHSTGETRMRDMCVSHTQRRRTKAGTACVCSWTATGTTCMWTRTFLVRSLGTHCSPRLARATGGWCGPMCSRRHAPRQASHSHAHSATRGSHIPVDVRQLRGAALWHAASRAALTHGRAREPDTAGL